MKTLKDYLAYARAYINPRISERAGMQLIVKILSVGASAVLRDTADAPKATSR